jgi:hypothetical protein
MKKAFAGYFPPAGDDIDHLWDSSLFALDTNILLNLYRYSDSTRGEFLRVLHALKDRLWLPHRAAQEYFANRLIVMAQQEKAYDETLKTIQALQADLSNARQHPFVSDKLMQKLTHTLGEVVRELTSTKAAYTNRTSADEIQSAVGELFDGRVGPPYSFEELQALAKEGEDRYTKKVPPGYKDEGKDNESSLATVGRRYGDLLIWRQVMDQATTEKKGIIFINDDKKEDWYLIFRGKTLGPRPELIEEFMAKTGQSFYMYQADRFLEHAAKRLEQKIAPESMVEIREVRNLTKRNLDREAEIARLRNEEIRLREELKVREMRIREEIMLRDEEMMHRARTNEARERLETSMRRLHLLREKAARLEHGQAVYQEKLDRSRGEDHESLEKLLDMQRQAAAAEREIAEVQEEMRAMENECATSQHLIAELQRTTESGSRGFFSPSPHNT